MARGRERRGLNAFWQISQKAAADAIAADCSGSIDAGALIKTNRISPSVTLETEMLSVATSAGNSIRCHSVPLHDAAVAPGPGTRHIF